MRSRSDNRGGWRVVGRFVLPMGFALCAVFGIAVAMGLGARGWGRMGVWLIPALTNGMFLACAAILVVGVGLTVIAGTALWRLGEQGRTEANRGQKGNAMIEFMLILPFALTMVLVMVQATALMIGNLCVHYSAYCAARTAIVSVPIELGDPTLNSIVNRNKGSSDNRIRIAAYYAVMPISCGNAALPDSDIPLKDALDRFYQLSDLSTPYWVRAQIGRKWQYAKDHTDVELVVAGQNGDIQSWQPHGAIYTPNEDITVRVTHVFYLAVPFARALFSMGSDGVRLDLGAPGLGAEYGTTIRAVCSMTNEGAQDFVDVEKFPP